MSVAGERKRSLCTGRRERGRSRGLCGGCLCEGDVVCLHLSGCEMLYDAFIGRWVGRRRQTLRATSVLKDP